MSMQVAFELEGLGNCLKAYVQESEIRLIATEKVMEMLEEDQSHEDQSYDDESLKLYEQRRQALSRAFSHVQRLPENNAFRIWLEDLLRMSVTFAQQQRDELYRRRHNAFVMYYVLKLDVDAIQSKQGMSRDSVQRDIDHVLDKMMIFAYGVDGLKPEVTKRRPKTTRKAIRKASQVDLNITDEYVENFAKGISAIRNGLLKVAEGVMPGFTELVEANNYSKCHETLSNLYSTYCQLNSGDPAKDLMDRLVNLHSECVDHSQSKLMARRHQIFVMKYRKKLPSASIADLTSTSAGTVYLDVKKTISDIMLLAFGIKEQEYQGDRKCLEI